MWETSQVLGLHQTLSCPPIRIRLLLQVNHPSNVPTSKHKQDIDTNPMVARHTNISSVGDKPSSWGTPFSAGNVMLSNKNEGVSMTASCLNVASINPEPGVNSNPTVGMHTKVRLVQDKSNCFGTPFLPYNGIMLEYGFSHSSTSCEMQS